MLVKDLAGQCATSGQEKREKRKAGERRALHGGGVELIHICAVAGVAAWPRAVSLAPCTMTKITLFTKNPRAEIPQSKAEAPPAGTDGRKSTLDQEPQCGKSTVIF